jgi:hypothetical protein
MYGSSKARDITKLTPEELGADLGLGPVASAIDVLVGGPACQAFARVGRSKLREIRTLILGKSKVSSNVKRVVEVGRRRAGTTFSPSGLFRPNNCELRFLGTKSRCLEARQRYLFKGIHVFSSGHRFPPWVVSGRITSTRAK